MFKNNDFSPKFENLTSTIIFSKKRTPLGYFLFLITLEIDDKLCFFLGLQDQLQCPECSYRGEKSQNVARHIALVHSKLDALLADKNLVSYHFFFMFLKLCLRLFMLLTESNNQFRNYKFEFSRFSSFLTYSYQSYLFICLFFLFKTI